MKKGDYVKTKEGWNYCVVSVDGEDVQCVRIGRSGQTLRDCETFKKDELTIRSRRVM